MGRIFYSVARPEYKDHPTLVHILIVPRGTVVIAMRPPKDGERGVAVGYDATILSVVDDVFDDWRDPEGPGWLTVSWNSRAFKEPNKAISHEKRITSADPYYEVTILAAFESLTAKELAAQGKTQDKAILFTVEAIGDVVLHDLGATPLAIDDRGGYHYADGSYGLIEHLGEEEARNIERIVLSRLASNDTCGIVNGITWRLMTEVRP